MKQGIVLIALGHPYYGRMAYNIALTLKKSDAGCQITLIHNGSSITHLNDIRLSIFDNIIELTDSKYWTVCDKTNYAFSKLFLNELSPYDETLFLDVDAAWCSKIAVSTLFKELKKQSFIVKNRNYFDLETGQTSDGKDFIYWADPVAVRNAYDFQKGKLYGLHLDFLYFKKTKQVNKVFETAIDIALKPKVNSLFLWANQNNADELPLSVSLVANNISLQSPYNPVHWGPYDSYFLSRNEVINSFYLLSTGGKEYNRQYKAFYNDLVKSAAYKLNRPQGFAHADKKTFLPERKSI